MRETVGEQRRTTGARARTAAVDVFRGLGLWSVYIDHMSPSVLAHFTLWHFGISDFAEIFVYLSGFIGIGSYERALDTGNTRGVLRTLARRMRRLYIAHVLSLTATMVVLWLCAGHGVRLNGDEWYVWMQDPAQYVLRVLTLTYAPVVFSLLPLYIAIAPVLVLAAIGLRRAPKLTLSISGALWLASQFPALDSRLTISAWFLHPAAWQFLFVLGACSRLYSDRMTKFARSRPVFASAAAIVAVSAALKSLTSFHSIFARLPGDLREVLSLNSGKPNLAYYRLLHFLALAVVVYAWTREHRDWFNTWIARLAMACGMDSLFIYSCILVLNFVVNLILSVTHGGVWMQLQLSLYGLALLCGMAWMRRPSSRPSLARFPVPSEVPSSE